MIFRQLTIHIFLAFLTFSAWSQNAEDSDQFLKDLNQDLLRQKKELDPFSDNKVKIDIESLGLDYIENKDQKSSDLPIIENLNNNDKKLDNINLDKIKQSVELDNKKEENDQVKSSNQENEKKEEKKEEGNKIKYDDQIDNKSINQKLNKIEEAKKDNEIIDSKSLDISNKLVKDALKENDSLIKEKQEIYEEKIKYLRKEYLLPLLDKQLLDGYIDEYNSIGSLYIEPQKKNLNQYIKDKTPALPILSRFRTNDNLHIPIIPTPQERINYLFFAIDMQNVRYFNSSYRYVQNPNVFNLNGDSLLTYAIINRNYPILASVLARGADPNMPNKLGYNPVTIAIEIKDFPSFYMLMERGANINYRDKFGKNYLMYAARAGFLPAIEYLLNKGLDINAEDNEGFNALSIAYKYENDIIIKYLIKNGAKTWNNKNDLDFKSQNPYLKDMPIMHELKNKW